MTHERSDTHEHSGNPNGNERESDYDRDTRRDQRSEAERLKQARDNQKRG